MKIDFYKFHGTGNDFILIDNRQTIIKPNNSELISFLCNRHLGIGADGLILLQNISDYDFEMIYFNSDGKQSSMCGNGGRCIVAFASMINIIKDVAHFLAYDNIHKAKIVSSSEHDYLVRLSMQDVENIHTSDDNYIIDSGSPHFISFVNGYDFDIINKAREIRYNDTFHKHGINVNFVKILNENENKIFVRTYERGVEDETLSCGTGVVAAAMAFAIKKNNNVQSVSVSTQGGELLVSFDFNHKIFTNVFLQGNATYVFDGNINANLG